MGPAHLNPAVSLAMAMTGAISWNLVVPFIIAQVLGAFAGAILVWLSYLPHWNATKDESAILGTFATGPAIRNYPANVITELIGTFVLVLGLLALDKRICTWNERIRCRWIDLSHRSFIRRANRICNQPCSGLWSSISTCGIANS